MSDDLQRALNTAANILSYSPRSRAALTQRLIEKGFEESMAEAACDRLAELNLLCDLEYAKALIESYAARGYGPARIRQSLRHKQIGQDDIDAALEHYAPREDKIEKYISSRLNGKTIDRKAIKKVSDGLFRRGFDWDDINSAVQKYISALEDETLG